MFTTILAAGDGSERARGAIPVAERAAATLGGER